MYNEIVKLNFKEIPVNISKFHCKKIKKLADMHYHDEIEILTVESGALCVETGGHTYIVRAGESIFISSLTVHKTSCAEGFLKYTLIQFNVFDYMEDNGNNIIRFINLSENPVFFLKENEDSSEDFYNIICNIADEFYKKNVAYAFYIKSYMYKLLALLLRYNIITQTSEITSKKLGEKLLPAIEYIENNYAEKITLGQLCKIVNLSEEYFCRIFKKATNATVTEYVNFVRISKAEKMLSTTTKTISEISMDTGFASVSYFNRIFKKYRKCSPSIYKKIKYSTE